MRSGRTTRSSRSGWPDPVHVDFAVLADYALIDQHGKLSVLGIFQHVWVERFPAIHPRTHLVLRVRGRRTEIGSHAVRIRFVDEHGQRAARRRRHDRLRRAARRRDRDRGRARSWSSTCRCRIPGSYAFEIVLDGQPAARVPMSVSQLAPPPAGRCTRWPDGLTIAFSRLTTHDSRLTTHDPLPRPRPRTGPRVHRQREPAQAHVRRRDRHAGDGRASSVEIPTAGASSAWCTTSTTSAFPTTPTRPPKSIPPKGSGSWRAEGARRRDLPGDPRPRGLHRRAADHPDGEGALRGGRTLRLPGGLRPGPALEEPRRISRCRA